MEAGGPGAAAAQGGFEEDDSELVFDDVGPEVGLGRRRDWAAI